MDIKYYKDYRHNYIIVKKDEIEADNYQCKMLAGNEISGLLHCQMKHINGELLFYYDISSKQSLSALYEYNYISMQQIKELFVQIKMVWNELEKYLLDEKNLILIPEYIYVDVETNDYYFLYYPYEWEAVNILDFLGFLVDRVNVEDREAVDIIYKIYELAQKDRFVMDEILMWFEQDVKSQSECTDYDMSDEEEETWILQEEPEGKEEEGLEKIKEQHAILALVAGLIAIVILIYICSVYQFSSKEMIYFYVVFWGAVFLTIGGGGWLFYMKWKQSRVVNTKLKNEHPMRNVLISDEEYQKEKVTYGNTVFIPLTEICENKLYGSGSGNKNHIDLSKLPVTVGKMAGSVDVILSEQSISRRHVKFYREDNQVYMTDLNSTNGTYKNGIRLLPNETEILEIGDEIRLGKLKFIYR